jgi:CheY-like chemotaxis protein
MTGLRRTIFVAALAAFAVSPLTTQARADEVSDTFNQGVDLLQRGRRAESLTTFRKLLGMGPTQAQAFDLWQNTPAQTWTDLLVEGGDFELIAKRLLSLSIQERVTRKADAEAISGLVAKATDTDADPTERLRATRTLASEHGEYAAGALVNLLGADVDKDRRDLAMLTLTRIGSDVVIPLMAALHTEDAAQRRSIVYTLGQIGDKRAAAGLLMLASADKDESVQKAAAESAARLQAAGSAAELFLALGEDYHHKRDNVLADAMWSDVLWSWKDRQLTSKACPRNIYAAEMSKLAYLHALHMNPASTEALAGLARAWCAEHKALAAMEKAGKDVGEWKASADMALTAVYAAGIPAIDMALSWSVKHGDSSTGAALCQVLGGLRSGVTGGLNAALACNDGAMPAEAAIALGNLASQPGKSASADVVAQLSASVSREVARVVLVIDGNAERSMAIASGLSATGVFVAQQPTGGMGLLQAHRGHVDAILVAESLSDMTTAAVIDGLKADERLAAVPVMVLAEKAEEATAAYGDKIAGVLTDAKDLSAVTGALSGELSGDRALAEDLAARAANTLAHLAHGSSDVSSALPALTGALKNRADAIAMPSLHALGAAGGAGETAAIVAVLADDARSEEVRKAAAGALVSILNRNAGALHADGLNAVSGVAHGSAALPVRQAAASVLAVAQLDNAARAKVLMGLSMGGHAASAAGN